MQKMINDLIDKVQVKTEEMKRIEEEYNVVIGRMSGLERVVG